MAATMPGDTATTTTRLHSTLCGGGEAQQVVGIGHTWQSTHAAAVLQQVGGFGRLGLAAQRTLPPSSARPATPGEAVGESPNAEADGSIHSLCRRRTGGRQPGKRQRQAQGRVLVSSLLYSTDQGGRHT